MEIQMIIFDVDGTLAETDDYIIEKSAIMLHKVLFFATSESLEKIMRPMVMAGETVLHGIYRVLDMIGLDSVISKIHSKYSVKKEYKYKEISGMQDTIRSLSEKYVLGIITSGGRKSTEAFLEKFGITDQIQHVISAEDCRFIKPHPMPILKIAEKAGLKPECCLMVGDTVFDIICARRAGAVSAAVLTGFDHEWHLRRCRPDFLLKSVNELPEILEQKNNDQQPVMPKTENETD